MITKYKFYSLAFISLLLISCMPVSRLSIDLGNGHDTEDLDKIENIVESLDFVRIWSETISRERSPRFENDKKVASVFESMTGFGIGLTYLKDHGSIQVTFSERGESFSDRGKQLFQQLVDMLRAEFGEVVTVNELGDKIIF